ncbi:MAG: hypothetical protein JNJ64_12220 [Flavobacteriales bacterium]|nr:hypothetical protein [Flavobacteriales bacterium]
MSERLPALALAAALPLLSVAQDLLPSGSLPERDRVEVRGGFTYDASTLLNELVLDLTQGGFVERDVRERSQAALRSNNRLGQVLQLGVHAVFGDSILGRAGLKMMVSATHQDHAGLRFRPDVYALTFFGNAGLAGERADLSGSAFEQQRYQTLGAGLYHARTGSWVRLDVVKGQSWTAVHLEDATLFTAADGTRLDLRLHGSYRSSDTARSDLGAFNGLGAAISFAQRFSLPERSGAAAHRITIGAEDLGAVRWNDRALRSSPDTAFTYDGITVDDVFDLTGAITGEEQLLDTFGVRPGTGAEWRLLPLHAWVEHSVTWPTGWRMDLRIAQRALPGFIPFAQATGWRRFGAQAVGISAQYGGFGGLRAGVHGRFRITRWLGAELLLPNLYGFTGPRARGLAAQIGLVFIP